MTISRTDPGTPDSRSAGRYLWWLITSQLRRVAAGALLGSLWMWPPCPRYAGRHCG